MSPAALAGLRVAVTRPPDPADELSARLAAHGATVLSVPLIRIAPPDDVEPLRTALRRLASYDCIIFTSANAVRAVLTARPPAPAPHARIAAVGPATARAVQELLGWRVDAMPDDYAGAALVRALTATGSLQGRSVLWPRALHASDVVLKDLMQTGALVDAPVAYRSVSDPAAARRLREQAAAGNVDVVTFTSPSAVDCYAASGGVETPVVVAVIGRVTAGAARRHGLPVHVEPAEHSIGALVEAVVEHVRGVRGPSIRGER